MRIEIPIADGPPTEVAQLFYDNQAGKLPTRDYYILSAVWVGENLHEYPIKQYFSMPQEVWEYAQGRITDKRQYSKPQAMALSSWRRLILANKQENDSNHEMFLWCIEKITPANISTSVTKIQRLADALLRLKFPFEAYDLAMRVSVLDADARQSGTKEVARRP